MDEITYDEFLDLLRDVEEDIDYDTVTDLVDGKYWDSFDIIAVINAVNDEYDITIPAKDIIEANFNSAQALYALVCRLAEED